MNKKALESLNNFNMLLGNYGIAEEGFGLKLVGAVAAFIAAAGAVNTGKRMVTDIKDKKRGNYNGKRDYNKIIRSLSDIKTLINELPENIQVSKSYYEKILRYKKKE